MWLHKTIENEVKTDTKVKVTKDLSEKFFIAMMKNVVIRSTDVGWLGNDSIEQKNFYE